MTSIVGHSEFVPSVPALKLGTVGQAPEYGIGDGTRRGTVSIKFYEINTLIDMGAGQPVGQAVGQLSQRAGAKAGSWDKSWESAPCSD